MMRYGESFPPGARLSLKGCRPEKKAERFHHSPAIRQYSSFFNPSLEADVATKIHPFA